MRSRPNPLYSLVDADYYESFDAYKENRNDFHGLVASRLPDGWRIRRQGIWFHCGSSFNILPLQGWKIHISSAVAQAREMLDCVIALLFQRRDTDFKFALDKTVLALLNGKNWPRGNANKFITIYPQDNHHFLQLIEQLHTATTGFPGPYILSDYRYKDNKVVYYRYGGFRHNNVLNIKGELTPVLVAPDGSKVPDQRLAHPVTPPWTKTPLPARDKPEQPQRCALREGRYEIEAALQFSNAGGIYRAMDAHSGKSVVIKEARPYVSDTDGHDAVELLKKEYRLLQLLSATGIAPQPIEIFQEWEHWFLVEEHIDGVAMSTHSLMQNALLRTRLTSTEIEEWYESFKRIAGQLATIIDLLHRMNIVFADLSTNNLMVEAGSKKLRIIDFEAAREVRVDPPLSLHTPGFTAAERISGSSSSFEGDCYSMGAVLLAYLFPINGMLCLEPQTTGRVLESIRSDLGLPRGIVDVICDLMSSNPDSRPAPLQVIKTFASTPKLDAKRDRTKPANDYASLIDSIAKHTIATATYHRKDRLFPGDARLFNTNPVSLAYGAAGVVYALAKTTGSVPHEAIDWLLRHTSEKKSCPPGLFIGLSGVAWTLLEVGIDHEAEAVMRMTFDHPLLDDALDLFYGKAGWGLACLRFFERTGNEVYLDRALRTANSLIGWTEQRHTRPLNEIGMAHGASGIALFLLYTYLATRDERFLVTGQECLECDLQLAVETRDGGLSWASAVDSPSPIYPYWRYGSAGIGQVVLRFYRLLRHERYWRVLEQIFVDTDRKYAVFPGKFLGLAGLGDFVLDMYGLTQNERYLASARKIADGILNFRVDRNGCLAFPGESLTRLSCDYGTGSAGIASFLHRLLGRAENDLMLDSLFSFRTTPMSGNDERLRAA
jgi:serine/threonine protein kinase